MLMKRIFRQFPAMRPLRAAMILLLGIAVTATACSPYHVHKRPAHRKGEGFLGKTFHKKQTPCGC